MSVIITTDSGTGKLAQKALQLRSYDPQKAKNCKQNRCIRKKKHEIPFPFSCYQNPQENIK